MKLFSFVDQIFDFFQNLFVSKTIHLILQNIFFLDGFESSRHQGEGRASVSVEGAHEEDEPRLGGAG